MQTQEHTTGVVVGLAILGLGVAKGIRSARSTTVVARRSEELG
jgi:F0F1-type ATP synthase membrane subunit c/vacuolar-type H+-ATPase subunit K